MIRRLERERKIYIAIQIDKNNKYIQIQKAREREREFNIAIWIDKKKKYDRCRQIETQKLLKTKWDTLVMDCQVRGSGGTILTRKKTLTISDIF